jgi:ribosomal-protein-serine acetyltransferase
MNSFGTAKLHSTPEKLTAFGETELSARTEMFGNIAHRFSHYAKRGMTTRGPIDVRGVISTQFVRTSASQRRTQRGTRAEPRCAPRDATNLGRVAS